MRLIQKQTNKARRKSGSKTGETITDYESDDYGENMKLNGNMRKCNCEIIQTRA